MSSSGRATNQTATPLLIQGSPNTAQIDVDNTPGQVHFRVSGTSIWVALPTGELVPRGTVRAYGTGVQDIGTSAIRWRNIFVNGVVQPITTQTGATYTVSNNSDCFVIANSGAITVTLPDATIAWPGRSFTVKNINAASATVATQNGQTIDGAASVTLAQWARIDVVSDGAQWLVVGS